MVATCVLCGESTYKGSQTSFHVFPKAPDLRSKWIRACNLHPQKVTWHTKVCSNHFTSDNFQCNREGGHRILKPSVVPSVFQNWRVKIRNKIRKQMESVEEIIIEEVPTGFQSIVPPDLDEIFSDPLAPDEVVISDSETSEVKNEGDNLDVSACPNISQDQMCLPAHQSDINISILESLLNNAGNQIKSEDTSTTRTENLQVPSQQLIIFTPTKNGVPAPNEIKHASLPFIPFNKVIILKPTQSDLTKQVEKSTPTTSSSAPQAPQPGHQLTNGDVLNVQIPPHASDSESSAEPADDTPRDIIKRNRIMFPRYFGDIESAHFSNSAKFERVKNIHKKQRLRIRLLQQKNRRLRKRIEFLQGIRQRLKHELDS